ncbi:hypothetical protein KKB64_04035 [Patescibacteria group bacterium]|nr:hypothetical protein [Patescibacteria group bacterium]
MKKYLIPMLSVFFVFVSFYPSVYEITHRGNLRPERAFELVHNFPTDYNFYLSRIREGIEGRWTVVERYTSEPHQGSFIHIVYVLAGQVGRFLRVPLHRSADIYHVARIVLGFALLMLIGEYVRKSFRGRESGIMNHELRKKSSIHHSPFTIHHSLFSILAFLLVVTASGWPSLVYHNNRWLFGGHMAWWSIMDTLIRITHVPHLLAGQALIVFLVLAFSHEKTMKKSGNWIILGVLGLVLGVVFPPGLIMMYAILLVLFGVEMMDKTDMMKKKIIPYVVFGFISVPALIYLSLMTSVYPWKRLAEFDIINPLPFNYIEYVKALGPLLPLGLIGLIIAFIKKEKHMYASVAWALAWITLLAVFQFIPQQSPLRFTEMAPHIPLGVLTAYVFYSLFKIPFGLPQGGHYSLFIIPVFIIILGLGSMYSTIEWLKEGIDTKMNAAYPLVPTGAYLMYPLKDFMQPFYYILDNTPPDAVVLSETTAGNYIPVYSGHTVYVGHANTVRAEEKGLLVRKFFAGRMSVNDAQAWLAKERISIVYFGPQEKEDGGIGDLKRVYPFLVAAFTNPHVTVYRVP